jgi:hypothetical protein
MMIIAGKISSTENQVSDIALRCFLGIVPVSWGVLMEAVAMTLSFLKCHAETAFFAAEASGILRSLRSLRMTFLHDPQSYRS